VSRQFYYPFGGIRNPGGASVVDTGVGFTGQRLDESTGLMFCQARYYDPLTARFISADTIIPDPGNPQDFNRYSYVRNNPVGYTDPSGNCATRNGTIIDDASTDPRSPPGIRWVSLAEGLGYTGDGMPTCNMVPGLYQCSIDSNRGDPSLGNLVFGLIALGFNLSPLGVLTDLAECSEGNKVSCDLPPPLRGLPDPKRYMSAEAGEDQFAVTAGQGYDAAAWIRGEVDVDDSRDTGRCGLSGCGGKTSTVTICRIRMPRSVRQLMVCRRRLLRRAAL